MTLVKRLGVTTEDEREAAIEAAATAVRRGLLVVLPTDTVYGVAADAFDAAAVQALLDAKGRGRDMPPPVLITATTLDGIAVVSRRTPALAERFWPGPLTILRRSRRRSPGTWATLAARSRCGSRTTRSLGDPRRTGPLAVSAANPTGLSAARDGDEAERMLGDSVEVIIDGGPVDGGEASTIVDCTGPQGRVLRRGALSLEELNEVLEPLGVALTTG